MTVRNTFATEIEANVLQLKEEGWCVIEGVIPENEVGAVREEAETSQVEYQRFSEGHGIWATNVIAFMPSFATYLADSRVLGVAKALRAVDDGGFVGVDIGVAAQKGHGG